MPPRRHEYALPEDAFQVLVQFLNYETYSFGENGVVLVKENDPSHRHPPIELPYGVDRIPADILEHVFSRTDFTMDEFWRHHDAYVKG